MVVPFISSTSLLSFSLNSSCSDATRVKIRDKLREQWDLKKKIRGYQESCLQEWKASVAEAARVGGHGEEELQWNSYSVIKKRLREAERAAAKKPKRVAKPRPLKTEEHRQRISAAIRAKWEDPVSTFQKPNCLEYWTHKCLLGLVFYVKQSPLTRFTLTIWSPYREVCNSYPNHLIKLS